MANMTLSIPDDMYEEMRKFSEIRWSEVARTAILSRLDALKLVDKLAKKRKLTKTDVKSIGRKLRILSKKR
ncbi:MAG: hypothetical protein NDI94_03680 [Candidatus Woesearchaeota archaeon]|nr:hypothetical protein [Candidatus Woesearchaeota archaeon]